MVDQSDVRKWEECVHERTTHGSLLLLRKCWGRLVTIACPGITGASGPITIRGGPRAQRSPYVRTLRCHVFVLCMTLFSYPRFRLQSQLFKGLPQLRNSCPHGHVCRLLCRLFPFMYDTFFVPPLSAAKPSV
jgi:hypothetical protein